MMASAIPSIAILASGRGSNFDAIQEAIKGGKLRARIVRVVSDREAAPVLEKARAAGYEAVYVPLKNLSREMQDEALLRAIHGGREKPRFLVLAGFMRLLGPQVISAFADPKGFSRIVNVHPAILPSFPGLHSYAQAYEYGCAVAGVTVHLVDEKVDHGPICAQEAFSIADCKNAGEVEARGLAIEHRLYPQTLDWILQEKFQLIPRDQGRFCVRPS
jgi:phosphoribosylglycinamide formyltransferase 1